MIRLAALLFILSVIASAQLIDDDELPFGGYSGSPACSTNYFSSDDIDSMRTVLGINQHICGGFTPEYVDSFCNHEIYPHPWGGTGGGDPQVIWAPATYFICQPESSKFYNVKFRTHHLDSWPPDPSDSFGVYSDSGTMLGNLGFSIPNWARLMDPLDQLKYYPSLRMKIDTLDTGFEDSLVGVFWVNKTWPDSVILLVDSIYYDRDIPLDSVVVLELENNWDEDSTNYFYVRPETDTVSSGGWVKYTFVTYGNFKVYVDYFKLHDQHGDDIVENNIHDDDIKESVIRPGFKDKILAWFLKDTQSVRSFRTFDYINDLIKEAMVDSNWTYKVEGATWLTPGSGTNLPWFWGDGYRDFIRIVRPEMLWAYSYPIGPETEYTGDGDDQIQKNFNYYIARPCDSIRAVLADSVADFTEGWLYTPQYWFASSEFHEPRREPTKSEARCQTFMGLCYHPISILFWKFDYETAVDRPHGLVYPDGSLSSLGEVVRDDINPYIKAIDSTYLGLTWDTAFVVSSPTQTFSGLVKSLRAVPIPESGRDNPVAPPDNGWFHVGEFYDDSNDKYFMLVNRACSKDSIGTEAPEVTAVVQLNPTAIGSDFVFIIDIAKGTNAANWVGYPDTIYAAATNGFISYSTTLKAGEGRLYKVAPTNERW